MHSSESKLVILCYVYFLQKVQILHKLALFFLFCNKTNKVTHISLNILKPQKIKKKIPVVNQIQVLNLTWLLAFYLNFFYIYMDLFHLVAGDLSVNSEAPTVTERDKKQWVCPLAKSGS
jgi:hypothetical protein